MGHLKMTIKPPLQAFREEPAEDHIRCYQNCIITGK